ncbi:DUF4123 domain-containing protein [Aureimonas sp. ME7]|uniref:DUF4123 domain-containing protein n=1 Tax=Aureimonas sp. ME7 TaxID=2744252 RepID=UPI0015F60BEA|nr:DUF4123 domain-containing protein [Aureimonas sp. ME7]
MAEDPSGLEARLFDALADLARDPSARVYAVMDGAMVADLPQALARSRLDHRSLVQEGSPREVAALGLWLVDPAVRRAAVDASEVPEAADLSDEALALWSERMGAEAEAALAGGDETGGGAFSPHRTEPADPLEGLAAVREIAGSGPGLVFWCGGPRLGLDTLFRHLRGLGRIVTEGEREEIVLFRHGDANVLAQVLPALGDGGLARFLGPADFVLFAPGKAWGGGLKRAGPAVGEAPAGMLRIGADALGAMEEARLGRSRDKVAAYLREVAPLETAGLDDAALGRRVREYEADGARLGLRSERAHAQWSFLMLTTGGQVAGDRDVRRALERSRDPDRALARMLRHAGRLEQQAASSGEG